MDMGLIMSAMFIGTIGLGVFIYGKKAGDLRWLALGLVLMIYPYFVSSMAMLWIIAAVCFGGTVALTRLGIADMT